MHAHPVGAHQAGDLHRRRHRAAVGLAIVVVVAIVILLALLAQTAHAAGVLG
jgi:hypothetical protein